MNREKIRGLWNRRRVQLLGLCVIALCLCVFHIGNDMASWSRRCFAGGEPLQICRFLLMLLHTFVSIALFLLLVVRSRVMAYVVLPYVLFTWAVPAYLRVTMGHCLYSELVTGFLATNWREVSGFLNVSTIGAGFVMIVGSFGLGYVCRRFFGCVRSLPGVPVWIVVLGYLLITILPVPLLAEKYPKVLLPLLYKIKPSTGENRELQIKNMLIGMENEYRPEYPYRVLLPFYRQLAFVYYVADYYMVKDFKPAEVYPSSLSCGDDVVVVLFIGESYRAQNASWNGYSRETLPQLSTLRKNTINFPFFKSYATSTISSIYGMISDATCSSRKAVHTSFLSVMAKHNFNCHLVLSRTTRWDLNPKINKLFAGKLDEVIQCNDSNGVISAIEQVSKKGGRQVILVEDGTGHAPYDHESKFVIYQGNNRDRYDNCLLQTDDLLFRVAETLKGRKAVMLYSSDHGQSFGEQGCWMHGGALNVVQQRHVFSFVWYSDVYAAAHPTIIENMKANARKMLSHDDIYLSILSLASIECKLPTNGCGDFCKPMNRGDVQEFVLEEDL